MKKKISLALTGAVSFATIGTILQFFLYKKLNYSSLIGGITWFIVAMIIPRRKT
ncbi:hypothetical protein [Paenibacillus sp. Soil766]|uniref:hypothetical protein n=1 Tax=Paenibacillus sp. Soil766 TaxID=1736404 RepID=UPI000A68AD97|nr:hypothetical protein [Paenibacillus sp. Soil766]